MITNFLMLWKKIQARSRIYWKLIFMFAYEHFPISVWSFYYITPILSQSSETGYSQRTRQGGISVKLSIHSLIAEPIFTLSFQLEWIQWIQVQLHVAVYRWLFLRGLHNKVVNKKCWIWWWLRIEPRGTSVKLSIHLLVAELIFTVCFQLEWIQCIQVELHVAVYWWLFLRGLHNKVVIVCKGVPAPLFKAPTPWPSLAPIFKIFVSPLLFSAPPPFKVF